MYDTLYTTISPISVAVELIVNSSCYKQAS